MPLSQTNPVKIRYLLAMALISLLALALVFTFLLEYPDRQTAAASRAARQMHRCLALIQEHCRTAGITLEKETDPNATYLIGPEQTPLTTTLGHVDAKRTTTNPRIAGLIAELLIEAGVGPGDRVAIGSSASFPGLMIASICAVQALEAKPAIILSYGSSSFGATRPEFTLIDMYDLLQEKGVFIYPAAGYSLGGLKDTGHEFPDDLRQRFIDDIRSRDIPFVYETDLQKNIEKRMEIFKPSEVTAFINCGGSLGNMGTSSKILYVKPGLNRELDLPPKETWGAIFAMASRGIPVIHLLFIKGLAQKHGLIWDPVPLPGVEHTGLGYIPEDRRTLFIILLAGYFAVIGWLIWRGRG